jgi:hypothetical protein
MYEIMSFKNFLRLSQIKQIPCLIMPMSTKCQKNLNCYYKKCHIVRSNKKKNQSRRKWSFEPIKASEYTCQKSDTSVADAVNLWLNLELPAAYKENLKNRQEMAMKCIYMHYVHTIYTLHTINQNLQPTIREK